MPVSTRPSRMPLASFFSVGSKRRTLPTVDFKIRCKDNTLFLYFQIFELLFKQFVQKFFILLIQYDIRFSSQTIMLARCPLDNGINNCYRSIRRNHHILVMGIAQFVMPIGVRMLRNLCKAKESKIIIFLLLGYWTEVALLLMLSKGILDF